MTSGLAVRLERTISAPPQLVYRAWLDPALLQRWLAPGSMDVSRVEVDERVGGRFRVWQSSAEHDAGGFECQIVELVPARRMGFRRTRGRRRPVLRLFAHHHTE